MLTVIGGLVWLGTRDGSHVRLRCSSSSDSHAGISTGCRGLVRSPLRPCVASTRSFRHRDATMRGYGTSGANQPRCRNLARCTSSSSPVSNRATPCPPCLEQLQRRILTRGANSRHVSVKYQRSASHSIAPSPAIGCYHDGPRSCVGRSMCTCNPGGTKGLRPPTRFVPILSMYAGYSASSLWWDQTSHSRG